MKKPLVSLIIPAYNAMTYLSACIESIFCSTYDNFEIVFIEDCSKDCTLDILQLFQSRYDNIHIIRNQENLGPGHSRNAGIDAAKGEYILFIDADDLIHPELLSLTVQYAEDLKLDLIYYSTQIFQDKVPNKMGVSYHSGQFVCTGKELFSRQELGGGGLHAPWCKLYRTQFLKDNGLRFYPGLWYEDLLFHFQCVMKAKYVIELKDKLYFYRKHDRGITALFDDREPESFFITLSEIYRIWLTDDFTDVENEAVGCFFRRVWDLYQMAILRCKRPLPWNGISNNYATSFLYKLLHGLIMPRFSIVSAIDCDRLRMGGSTFVYGARNRAAEIYRQLRAENIAVRAFIVSSMAGNYLRFANLPVRVLDEMNFCEDDHVIIAVSPNNGQGLEAQLRNHGVKDVIWPTQVT